MKYICDNIKSTMTTLRIKFFYRLLPLILSVYIFLTWKVLFSKTTSKIKESDSLNLSHVIVHLDLKGAPPKMSYLNKLLHVLKEEGATGLLMEYEDMFPYQGVLANLSSKNCYGKNELRNFIHSATIMGLEVIPLVQTFGHLESALKLQEFQHLREEASYPDSICPSKVGSQALVNNMVKQVLELHNSVSRVKFVHIGCDEVFHINYCGLCRRRMLNKEDIFLQHVIATSAHIKRQHPETTVLIWDDMLRGILPSFLSQYSLRKYVEPVVWDYKSSVDVTHIQIFKYYNNFDNIWIASAFKGAMNKATTVPDIKSRYFNHYSWMRLIKGYTMPGTDEVFKFRGIFLTGWSRFSHFDPLCEILPVSMPSLLMCLMVVDEFVKNNEIEADLVDGGRYLESKIFQKMYSKLNCARNVKVDNIADMCKFDELELYKSVIELNDAVNSVIISEKELHFVNGYLTNFYVENSFVNPGEIIKVQHNFEKFETRLTAVARNLTKHLSRYYNMYVTKEFINTKLYVNDIVRDVLNKIKLVKKIKTWKPGPIMFKSIKHVSLFNKTFVIS